MGHPVYRYRKYGDQVIAGQFDSDALPPDWHDAPHEAEGDAATDASEPKRKPGRPRKHDA